MRALRAVGHFLHWLVITLAVVAIAMSAAFLAVRAMV